MNVTRIPSASAYRKWSPAEILAIKDPLDTGDIQKARAGKAAAVAIANQAPGRAKKKTVVKLKILEIFGSGNRQTIRGLRTQIGDTSTNTITTYLKELEAEGLVCRNGNLWVKAN